MYRVVIVEDDPMVSLLDRTYTEKDARFQVVQTFQNGQAALEWLSVNPADLVILDVYMPLLTGHELLRELRSRQISVDAIMVTAANDPGTVDALLKMGVVDYLVKPFSMKELDARLRALVRRAQGRQTRSVLRWEDIELDPAAHSATRSGVPLRLSPTGFVILETLLRAAPTVVPRTELEQAIWGDSPPDSDALRTHIHELRQKLDKPFTCPLLKTIPHVGYTLVRHE